MQDIRIHVDFTEIQANKYRNIIDKEDFYGTPEYYIAYQNYRKSKGNPAEDLLTDLAAGAVRSCFDAIRHTFSKAYNKAALKVIDEAVKQAAIESGATWTD